MGNAIVVQLGQRFGRGVIVETGLRYIIPSRPGGHPAARLLCDCGNTYEARLASLRKGDVKSCGCQRRDRSAERAIARNTTHGWSKHPLYGTWALMVKRCTDTESEKYDYYGGRGVTIYPEWRDPVAFLTWVDLNLGSRPEGTYANGHPVYSIDRTDNDGNYEPGNLRWADRSEQANNRRPRRRKAA